uniref:CSON000740 protein n=1 Tax=Culicoides sonorensis TaxID=179676 RepID=A0A336LU31_CULSO
MRLITSLSCLLLIVAVSQVQAQGRRVRVRTRPVQDNEQLIQESENSEEDRRPIVQYYRADPRQDNEQRIVLVPASGSDEDYSDNYRPTTARARADYNRPQQPQQIAYRSSTVAPRRKDDDVTKAPPVQTIRNYNKVNDDGSFTFGYEAADGSFKEETRGTDCVVRGKYGYIDPDGNKREFTYVSGNPCDPNNPEGNDEDEASEEESNENVPQNYPARRPSARPIQAVRPLQQTTTRPTTVFQNVYAHQSLGSGASEEEEEENIPQTVQIGQQRPLRPSPRPQAQAQSQTPRHRVQIINTTPTPTTVYNQATHPVSITPRPNYRPAQTNPPATTYKPQLQFINTQKTVPAVAVTTPSSFVSSTRGNSYQSSAQKGQIDFDAEFKKFQKDNNDRHPSSTPSIVSTPKQFKAPTKAVSQNPSTNAPIYQSQLVYDPATGQYDSALYQQLPQTDGDFQLNHRIQPYVHQTHPQHVTAAPHLVNLQQLQDQSPLYRHQIQHSQQQQPQTQPQIPQQLYQKQQSELQFLNSQQLFAQQLQLQQSQLARDRQQAATRAPQHRFQVGAPAGQQYYYVQPNTNGNGQIDAFLRGHNIDFE